MPTALIVDDEPEANKLLSMLVRLRGYETVSAFSGEEALSLARDRPDVVFLDLMLPDRHGLEVCRTLRADPGTCLLPVVVVTARLAEHSRSESYQAGASDYVPKPYTPDQIFNALGSSDLWNRTLHQSPAEGLIACDLSDRFAFDRQLTGFRSLLLARSPLESEDVDQLASLVQNLCAASSRRDHSTPSVRFRLQDDRLTLSLLDESTIPESLASTLDDDLFHEITPAESGRTLHLTRLFNDPKPLSP